MSAALAELVRYTLAGGLVFVLYLGLTLGLSGAGLPIQVAIPVSYAIAVATHFALQRSFVFTGRGYALRTREQVARYVALGAVQYPTTALATALLPQALGLSEQLIYVAATLAISTASFLFLRHRVFHGEHGSDDRARER